MISIYEHRPCRHLAQAVRECNLTYRNGASMLSQGCSGGECGSCLYRLTRLFHKQPSHLSGLGKHFPASPYELIVTKDCQTLETDRQTRPLSALARRQCRTTVALGVSTQKPVTSSAIPSAKKKKPHMSSPGWGMCHPWEGLRPLKSKAIFHRCLLAL